VDDGDRWLRGCSGDPAWTRGSGEECSGPRRASPGEERAVRQRKKKGGTTAGDKNGVRESSMGRGRVPVEEQRGPAQRQVGGSRAHGPRSTCVWAGPKE
jgi:hypothetical protein